MKPIRKYSSRDLWMKALHGDAKALTELIRRDTMHGSRRPPQTQRQIERYEVRDARSQFIVTLDGSRHFAV